MRENKFTGITVALFAAGIITTIEAFKIHAFIEVKYYFKTKRELSKKYGVNESTVGRWVSKVDKLLMDKDFYNRTLPIWSEWKKTRVLKHAGN